MILTVAQCAVVAHYGVAHSIIYIEWGQKCTVMVEIWIYQTNYSWLRRLRTPTLHTGQILRRSLRLKG